MKIIPALDLQHGQSKFSFNGEQDVLLIAEQLKHFGVHTLLITDLDGVYNGQFQQYDVIKSLSTLGLDLIVSGGIRSLEDAKRLLESGATYILVSTIAMKDQDMLIELVELTEHKTMVAIDTFEDSVYIEGWLEESDVSPEEFILSSNLLGIHRFVHSKMNQTDDFSILNEQWISNLASEKAITITPVIDITKPFEVQQLLTGPSHEIILGGALDQFDWQQYKGLHL